MMKWMDVNGVGLRYELSGSAEQTVVMMHESGGSLDSWTETLPAFQQHFRTLRYDQRGFGQSEKIRGKITLDDVVGDLLGLLDGLGITAPCHLVGSALGTAFAIAFAVRHPARVARLAIASPVTLGHAAARRAIAEERATTIEREGMRSFVVQNMSTAYPEVMRGNRERYQTAYLRWLANDPTSFVAVNRLTFALDLTADLAKITCPTLVLGAIHDSTRPPAMAKAIAQQIHGARYIELESGHFMAVETPELFAQHVVPFLRGQG